MYLDVGPYDGHYDAEAHRTALLKVRRLQKTRSTDLAAVLRVLEAYQLTAPTSAFCAPASSYPEYHVLAEQVQYVLGALYHDVEDTYRKNSVRSSYYHKKQYLTPSPDIPSDVTGDVRGIQPLHSPRICRRVQAVRSGARR